ncbi:unannotated protein [freshwater metagenome]|uniref:Unannotated protein n=1 Tax=freshwater metagenome TaxID=449393 RepID=A0A6J7U2J2_9ZZZZ
MIVGLRDELMAPILIKAPAIHDPKSGGEMGDPFHLIDHQNEGWNRA